ncbi:hypothetical protein E2O24_07120 [Campylobacter volucris]|uniref:tetratricopeptide repeat protein n=1 Tax=Campylobacter volucris TaxID=1031542 RepID=UPI0010592688|nr:hypothetical protein [Campylobacter volucris]TDJ85830.1 hypothetical protein E2O24_07120 [Campylobacter volucris]
MFDKILYYFFNANYEKALQLSEAHLNDSPKFALEYASICAFKLQEFEKALYYANELFRLYPSSFFGLLLVKIHIANHNIEEAIGLLKELIQRNDDLNNEFVLELAFVYKNTFRLDEACELFEELIKIDYYNLDLWKEYAQIYFQSDFKKALLMHDRVCQIAHELIENINNGKVKTNTKIQTNTLEDKLLQKTKENVTIMNIENFLNNQILPQKAFLLFKLYDLENSIKLFTSLIPFNENNAQFWQNFAKALELSCNYQGAYEAYHKALNIHHHATYAFDCAYLLMRIGKFEEGVKMYESRLFYANNETFSSYHYNKTVEAFNKEGTKAFKNKTILIFCEQGFGDTIMYARCLEKICDIADKVLFAPQSALYRLFKNYTKSNDDKFKNMKVLKDFPPKFDFAMPICSLPLFCDIKLKDIPLLKTPIKELIKIKNKRKKIGIFWFTPSAVNTDLIRNFDLDFILSMVEKLDCDIVSFQVQGEFTLPDFIENRACKLKDWQDTFENLKDIDYMISIDSAIAHLTLALDIPTSVLLAPRFDWRWGKFEAPKSYFWPKANLIVCKDLKQAKAKFTRHFKKCVSDG